MLDVKTKLKLIRRMRKESKEGLEKRREVLSQVEEACESPGSYCIVNRQDKGHRKAYGYGDVKPNPIAFGKDWEVVVVNYSELIFNSPRKVMG